MENENIDKRKIIVRKPLREKSNILIRVVKLNKEGKQIKTRNISLLSEQGIDDIFMNILKILKCSEYIIKKDGKFYKRIKND